MYFLNLVETLVALLKALFLSSMRPSYNIVFSKRIASSVRHVIRTCWSCIYFLARTFWQSGEKHATPHTERWDYLKPILSLYEIICHLKLIIHRCTIWQANVHQMRRKHCNIKTKYGSHRCLPRVKTYKLPVVQVGKEDSGDITQHEILIRTVTDSLLLDHRLEHMLLLMLFLLLCMVTG